MKASDLRELGMEELQGRTSRWEEALFRARCELAGGQRTDTSVFRKLRQDIARAKTTLRETQPPASTPRKPRPPGADRARRRHRLARKPHRK